MGGGIIIISKDCMNRYHLLFGREAINGCCKKSDKGKFSDFGGAADKGETDEQTALREFMEETMGLYLTKETMKKYLKENKETVVELGGYSSFLLMSPWDIYHPINFDFPGKLKASFDSCWKNNRDMVFEHNGLYEKDMARWIRVDLLQRNLHNFRPWYKKHIREIIKYFSEKYDIKQLPSNKYK